MRIALGLAYDGASFTGWQTQPDGRGVQDSVEAAIAAIAGHAVATICAGRTDARVHGLAQVVHFDTEASRPEQAWVRGVNSHLPPTVSVQWMRAVPDDFHARFGALARRYRYIIARHPVRQPLWHGRAAWVFRPLDVDAMRMAARHLVGEHDFSAFRAAECQAASPVRTVHELEVEARGAFVVVSIRANAFLHHMVRNIVGSLVDVGLGRHGPDWIAELIAGRDRSRAAGTFPAEGLYFAGVDYPARFGLPDVAAVAPWDV